MFTVYSIRVNVMKPGKSSYFTPKSKDMNRKWHIKKMKHIFRIIKILKAHFPSKSHYHNVKNEKVMTIFTFNLYLIKLMKPKNNSMHVVAFVGLNYISADLREKRMTDRMIFTIVLQR